MCCACRCFRPGPILCNKIAAFFGYTSIALGRECLYYTLLSGGEWCGELAIKTNAAAGTRLVPPCSVDSTGHIPFLIPSLSFLSSCGLLGLDLPLYTFVLTYPSLAVSPFATFLMTSIKRRLDQYTSVDVRGSAVESGQIGGGTSIGSSPGISTIWSHRHCRW